MSRSSHPLMIPAPRLRAPLLLRLAPQVVREARCAPKSAPRARAPPQQSAPRDLDRSCSPPQSSTILAGSRASDWGRRVASGAQTRQPSARISSKPASAGAPRGRNLGDCNLRLATASAPTTPRSGAQSGSGNRSSSRPVSSTTRPGSDYAWMDAMNFVNAAPAPAKPVHIPPRAPLGFPGAPAPPKLRAGAGAFSALSPRVT